MASDNQRFLHIPAGEGPTYSIIGERIAFKVTSAQTGDVFSVMDLISPPGGGPPLHTHPAAEAFFILEGEFEFSGLDGETPYTTRATAGDTVFIPGGAAHTYHNAGVAPGRALGVLAPGGEMERFFIEAGVPVHGQSAPASSAQPPSAGQIAQNMEIAARHGITFLAPRDEQVSANERLEARRD